MKVRRVEAAMTAVVAVSAVTSGVLAPARANSTATFFVAIGGDDAADGLSLATPFRTIQRWR